MEPSLPGQLSPPRGVCRGLSGPGLVSAPSPSRGTHPPGLPRRPSSASCPFPFPFFKQPLDRLGVSKRVLQQQLSGLSAAGLSVSHAEQMPSTGRCRHGARSAAQCPPSGGKRWQQCPATCLMCSRSRTHGTARGGHATIWLGAGRWGAGGSTRQRGPRPSLGG